VITVSKTILVRLKANAISAPQFSGQQVEEFNKIQ
jgi:hypothetical protein